MNTNTRPYMEFGSNPFSDVENIRKAALNEASNDPKLNSNKGFASYYQLYSDAYTCINNWRKSASNAELHAKLNGMNPELVSQQVRKIAKLGHDIELINSQPIGNYSERFRQLYSKIASFIIQESKCLPVLTSELKEVMEDVKQVAVH